MRFLREDWWRLEANNSWHFIQAEASSRLGLIQALGGTMTIDQSVATKLADLIPVAAGALIALAGSGIKYWVDVRDRKRQVKREKLERVLRVAHDLMDWTSQVDDRYVYGSSSENVPSLMDEMSVLAALYFPELRHEIQSVVLEAKRYKNTALALGRERLSANGIPSPDQAERINAAYSPLLVAISQLTTKAESVAAELL